MTFLVRVIFLWHLFRIVPHHESLYARKMVSAFVAGGSCSVYAHLRNQYTQVNVLQPQSKLQCSRFVTQLPLCIKCRSDRQDTCKRWRWSPVVSGTRVKAWQAPALLTCHTPCNGSLPTNMACVANTHDRDSRKSAAPVLPKFCQLNCSLALPCSSSSSCTATQGTDLAGTPGRALALLMCHLLW